MLLSTNANEYQGSYRSWTRSVTEAISAAKTRRAITVQPIWLWQRIPRIDGPARHYLVATPWQSELQRLFRAYIDSYGYEGLHGVTMSPHGRPAIGAAMMRRRWDELVVTARCNESARAASHRRCNMRRTIPIFIDIWRKSNLRPLSITILPYLFSCD